MNIEFSPTLANVHNNLFIKYFNQIEDVRDPVRTRYPLMEVLFLVVCSVISGYEENRAIEQFGKSKLSWLRKFFPFENGIPTHESIGIIIGLIDKKAFESIFIKWVNAQYGIKSGELIHIDGKRISSSAKKLLQDKKLSQGGQRPESMINAYVSNTRSVVGQINISKHEDEKQGAKELIELLHLKDRVITGDGNFCTKDILLRIRRKQGHYLMSLKKNNKNLYELSEKYFTSTYYGPNQSIHQTNENGHGRTENRIYRALDTHLFKDKKFKEYSGLKQIIRVDRKRTVNRKNKTTTETQYYLTSTEANIEVLANMIRKHWSIENSLHWVLDVEFKEDDCTKRTGNQASNFSLIRKAVLNIVNEKRGKKSIKAIRMQCALDDNTREIILGIS